MFIQPFLLFLNQAFIIGGNCYNVFVFVFVVVVFVLFLFLFFCRAKSFVTTSVSLSRQNVCLLLYRLPSCSDVSNEY